MTVQVFSFFVLKRGTIVNFGLTTVQPFVTSEKAGYTPGFGNGHIGGVSGPYPIQVTHLTGSIPNGTPSIVAATGRYRHVTGTARISGAVSVLTIDGNTDTGPSFDCLWEVKLGDEDEDEDEEDKNDDEDD